MHFYRFPLKDYLARAGHLMHRPLEDITFRRLIDLYWLNEVPLQDDLPALARRIGMDEAMVGSVLKEFFERSEDDEGKSYWKLQWIDKGIERVNELSKRQKEKADKRWSRSASSN